MITVSKDGSGNYTSIDNAIQNAVPYETIFIKNGIYNERIEVYFPLNIIGEDKNKTIIEYGLYAKMNHNGEKLGTFRSYTMLVNTDNFTCRNITISNNAGFGKDVGQAISVYAEGDNITFENCCILGHQDTLFTGPLPFKEIEKGGFKGPTEFAERRVGRQRYLHCYIEGEVDFIFGSAAAYFNECELCSLNCGNRINGYVTAASTYQNRPYGYVFNKCRFTGDCPVNSVYLGRPWRENAQTVLIDCYIGPHICDELFHDWNKADSHNSVFYALCRCYGKNINKDKIPSYVRFISHSEADNLLLRIQNDFEV